MSVNNPFICVKCESRFSNYSLLVEHRRIHEIKEEDMQIHEEAESRSMEEKENDIDESDISPKRRIWPSANMMQLQLSIAENIGKVEETQEEKFENQQYGMEVTAPAPRLFISLEDTVFERNTWTKFYQCSICAKRLTTLYKLERHLTVHSKLRIYSCNYCEARYKSKEEMRRHLRRIHKRYNKDNGKGIMIEVLPCFVRLPNVQLPCEVLQTGNVELTTRNPEVSGFCKRGEDLELSRGGKFVLFKCKMCNLCFKHVADLEKHYKKKYVQDKFRRYKCDKCPWGFPTRQKLLKHDRVHSFAKPKWNCQICCKAYKYKDSLRQHMLSHDGYRYEYSYR